MRIAMVVGVFPLLSEIYIVRQTARLIELGHEVDLYTLTHSGSELATREVERYKLGERLTCMGEGYLRQGEATWIARTATQQVASNLTLVTQRRSRSCLIVYSPI